MSRARPELDPSGVRLGSFVLFPTLGIVEAYSDNLFKTERDRRDDAVLRVTPAARLESDWSNHAIELGAEADIAVHAVHGSEDHEDLAAWATGRLDVTSSTNLFGGAAVANLHEDRGSPNEAGGRRPTMFNRSTAHFGAAHRLNRVSVEGEARFVELDFDDVASAAGGEINNDDRDHEVYVGAVKLGYEIVPRYLAFIRGAVNERDYRAPVDDFNFNRDSYGYDIAAGTEFDLTGITFGEVHLGYREQIYQDRRFGRIDGLSFGGRLTSNVTPLTTLQLSVDREIEETSVTQAEGYWSTAVRLRADHELLRNLIISADLRYSLAEFASIDRNDDVLGAGLSASFQVNRHLGVAAGYRYEERDSSGAARDEDYAENLFLLSVSARL